MSRVGPRERMRYWFDKTMSRGTPALIAWLGITLVLLIAIVTALAMTLAPDHVDDNPLSVAWKSLLRTLDPGTMGGDQGSPQFLALMLAVTIGGIFLVSALVGILATGLDAKLTELRKGRSRVIESGHTVILGWSDQIFTIVGELVRANEGQRACITILADEDKVQMEDALHARLPRPGKVRIVCRRGSPTEPTDVELMQPDEAAVILVPVPAADEPDVHVIKALLALRNRRWTKQQPPVIAAIADSPNVAAAVLAGGDAAQIIDAKDVIASWWCSRGASPASRPYGPTCSASRATRSTCAASLAWSGRPIRPRWRRTTRRPSSASGTPTDPWSSTPAPGPRSGRTTSLCCSPRRGQTSAWPRGRRL